MSAEQIAAAVAAALVVIGGGGFGMTRMRRPASETVADTTDVLLGRISELEAALTAERARTVELELQVQRLREERRELSTRVSHLEGQVATLSNLVTKLVERSA